MSINDFQELMAEIYLERDLERGKEKTFMWLVEEVGELSDSMLRGNKSQIEEEISDVFAWLASLCNVLDVNLEGVVFKKYNKVCPRCVSSPCECPID